MDLPIIINWVSPLPFLGPLCVILNFYSIFDEISLSKQNSPRWDAAASHLGLYCLPMSHKRDARLKLVKPSAMIMYSMFQMKLEHGHLFCMPN